MPGLEENEYIVYGTIIATFVVIVSLLMWLTSENPDGLNEIKSNGLTESTESTESLESTEIEGFYGSYYPAGYPYDYPFPYYYPYFYSGCNENVFGEIRCLPPMSLGYI